MADSLSLLRQYTIDGKTIEERDGHVVFGEFSWPATSLTNFVCYRYDFHNFKLKILNYKAGKCLSSFAFILVQSCLYFSPNVPLFQSNLPSF